MAAIMQPLSGISSNAPTNEEKALEPQSGTTVSGMNVFNSNKVVRKASFTRQLRTRSLRSFWLILWRPSQN